VVHADSRVMWPGRLLPPLLPARGTSPRYAFIFRSVLTLCTSATSAKKASATNSVTPLMLIRSSTWLRRGSPASRISVASRSFASI